MEFLFPVLLSIHILVGLGVIGLVLLQHGKGADMGAAFGSGASGSLFGASGSANFLSRTTAILAAVFFLTSLGLSYVSGSKPKAPESIMEAPLAPPPGGAVTVPLPAAQPADVPVPGEKSAAPASEQKPVDAGETKPTEAKPAAATGANEAATASAKEGVPSAADKAAPDTKADQKAEKKPAEKPAEKAESKAVPKASPKAEKDAAAKKSGTETPASDSKAKDIPK